MPIEIYTPDELGKPAAPYNFVARARSNAIYLAGIVSTDASGQIVGADDFDAQCAYVYSKIGRALASAGAGFGNIVQFTIYLTDAAHIPRFMEYRKREFPRLFGGAAYPPSTLLIVSGLVQKSLLIEIQTVAAL